MRPRDAIITHASNLYPCPRLVAIALLDLERVLILAPARTVALLARVLGHVDSLAVLVQRLVRRRRDLGRLEQLSSWGQPSFLTDARHGVGLSIVFGYPLSSLVPPLPHRTPFPPRLSRSPPAEPPPYSAYAHPPTPGLTTGPVQTPLHLLPLLCRHGAQPVLFLLDALRRHLLQEARPPLEICVLGQWRALCLGRLGLVSAVDT